MTFLRLSRSLSAVIARLDRAIQYAAASRFNHRCLWNTGSPAFAGDDDGMCVSILAAHCARGFAIRSRPSIKRAQGMPGAGWHPRSRVQIAQKMRTRAYRYSRSSPAFPARWVYGLLPCSPWRRIPFASVAGGLKALSKPGWISQNLRRLDASNGRQNHTALPSAITPFVGARPSLTGKPALRKPACAPGVPRPPLPAPNVRDDRDTPLLSGAGWRELYGVIWGEREAEYF